MCINHNNSCLNSCKHKQVNDTCKYHPCCGCKKLELVDHCWVLAVEHAGLASIPRLHVLSSILAFLGRTSWPLQAHMHFETRTTGSFWLLLLYTCHNVTALFRMWCAFKPVYICCSSRGPSIVSHCIAIIGLDSVHRVVIFPTTEFFVCCDHCCVGRVAYSFDTRHTFGAWCATITRQITIYFYAKICTPKPKYMRKPLLNLQGNIYFNFRYSNHLNWGSL